MVTLAIMGCGTLLIALVPGYQTIGVLAPILVLHQEARAKYRKGEHQRRELALRRKEGAGDIGGVKGPTPSAPDNNKIKTMESTPYDPTTHPRRHRRRYPPRDPTAPMGRIRKPEPNTAKVSISAANSLSAGKKVRADKDNGEHPL
jgi:hypothetical protein